MRVVLVLIALALFIVWGAGLLLWEVGHLFHAFLIVALLVLAVRLIIGKKIV